MCIQWLVFDSILSGGINSIEVENKEMVFYYWRKSEMKYYDNFTLGSGC